MCIKRASLIETMRSWVFFGILASLMIFSLLFEPNVIFVSICALNTALLVPKIVLRSFDIFEEVH